MSLVPAGKGEIINNPDYKELLASIQSEIEQTAIHTSIKVNQEKLALNWKIGKLILIRQEEKGWGSKVIDNLARDLKAAGYDRGYSTRTLKYMRKFAAAWPELDSKESIVQPLVAQLSWKHHILILDKLDTREEREFYMKKAVEEGWSSRVLELKIKQGLHLKLGASSNNFQVALPNPDSDLMNEIIKSEYQLDHINRYKDTDERDIELEIVRDIETFINELGPHFMFAGRQVAIQIDGDEFFIDLLFYHHTQRRFVVIELKLGKFKPSYLGQIGLYLESINQDRNHKDDKPCIGLIFCSDKNPEVAERSLKGFSLPVGIVTYQMNEERLEELQSSVSEEIEGLAELEAGVEKILLENKKRIDSEA